MAEKRKSVTIKARNPPKEPNQLMKEGDNFPIQLEPGDTVGIVNILRQSSQEEFMKMSQGSMTKLMNETQLLSMQDRLSQQEILSFDEIVLESNEIDLGRL